MRRVKFAKGLSVGVALSTGMALRPVPAFAEDAATIIGTLDNEFEETCGPWEWQYSQGAWHYIGNAYCRQQYWSDKYENWTPLASSNYNAYYQDCFVNHDPEDCAISQSEYQYSSTILNHISQQLGAGPPIVS